MEYIHLTGRMIMLRKLLPIMLAASALPLLALGIPAASASGTTHIWVGNGYTQTNQFPIGDATEASLIFNRPASYGIGSSTSSNPISNSYATTPCLKYVSDAQFESDIANNVIPNTTWPAGSCVLYDNEDGNGTPSNEYTDPETYMPQFNDDALDAGFVPVDTPGLDLGNAANMTGSPCTKSGHGGTNLSWYEQCHIAQYAVTVAGESTANAAGMVVQSQSQVDSTCGSPPNNFKTLVNDAEADVDSVNGGAAKTLLELSINYPGGGNTSDAIACAQDVGKASIDGVYLDTTNTDASTTGGWNDTVSTTLTNTDGW